MTDLLLNLTFETIISTICFTLAWPFAKERRIIPLLCILVFVWVSTLASVGPSACGVRLGHWNWLGKALSIMCSLLAFAVLKIPAKDVGLLLPRTGIAWLVSFAGIVLAIGFEAIRAYMANEINFMPKMETLAFQATMPGLDEELNFRGIQLALLMRAFPTSRLGMPRWVAPLLITSFIFTAVHMVAFQHGVLHFVWKDPLLEALPMGFLLGAIRLLTGSLLGPVLCHNAANLTDQLTSWWIQP